MSPKMGILFFSVVMSTLPAQGHDIYTHLKNGVGFHCCDKNDCRPAHYRISADGVEMLIDQTWLLIPSYDVQYRILQGDTGETYGGHWCGRNVPDAGLVTYCAFLPPNSVSAVGMVRNTSFRPNP
jgi:hypothetical protein